MADPFESGGSSRWKYLAGAVILVVIAAGAFMLVQSPAVFQGPGEQPQNNTTDEFEDYASANEKTGTKETSGAEVAATVTVGEFGVDPASVTIDTGQVVKWTNRKSFPIRFEFDRTPQTPTVKPGETLKMRFRGITYYKVYNANTDKQVGGGRINVQ